MEDTTQDAPEVLETPEEEIELDLEEEKPEEDVEALKEKNRQLYARAKKAEGFEQVDGKWVKKTETPAPEPFTGETLSIKDQAFLAKADIHEDDLDEVLDWAKFKNISVKEAYSNLKPQLEIKAESRRTAETANIGNVRRGPSKITDESLLASASAGKLPDSDADIERLVKAKLFAK